MVMKVWKLKMVILFIVLLGSLVLLVRVLSRLLGCILFLCLLVMYRVFIGGSNGFGLVFNWLRVY